MTTGLTITAPATLTVLAGSSNLSSIETIPPYGLVISGATAGSMTVELQAGSPAALVTASNIGGATVVNEGNTLTLTGTQTQINAALASVEVVEPLTLANDALEITASQSGFVTVTTGLAIDIIPQTGPAFVAPATLVTVAPDVLDLIPYLTLSDPIAQGLAAMGLGQEETLNLTLAVASGALFLPGFSNTGDISATGLGTGEIILNFTADQIGALNELLSGLEFAGPSIAGGEQFQYALRDLSGVLPYSLTRGNIFLSVAGAPGAAGSFSTGSQSLIEGGETLTSGVFITDTTSVLGNISGFAAVVVSPSGNLELPYNALFLGGTSLDFGTINATELGLEGDLIIAQPASIKGAVLLEPSSLLDFNGSFNAGAGLAGGYDQAIELSAGAEMVGSGTLVAGYFSESGAIEGSGAILARGGETLQVLAGLVTGGAQLEAGPGGVMVLGPLAPLYGVFGTTALTIDSSVTLSFQGNAGATPITGRYAGTLGGDGGAFVINGPQVFSGVVSDFQPGDALIFPGLSDFSILDVTNTSFTVAGLDHTGKTETYVIQADISGGDTPIAGEDVAGDPEVGLRPAAATVAQTVVFEDSAGVAQPLLGLSLELAAPTTKSLTLALSVAHGVLTEGSLGGASITLAASNIATLSAELAAITYTGTGIADTLTITAASGPLAGIFDFFALNPAAAGTVDGAGLPAFSEAQVASFTPDLPLVFSLPATPGALQVSGVTEFTGPIEASGVNGDALLVDAGGTAIFNDIGGVTLGADVVLGDDSGTGTLAILAGGFSSSGNLTLGAGSAADVLGALSLAGTLEAAGQFDVTGSLSASVTSLGLGGVLFSAGTAQLGGLADSGALLLGAAAQAQAGSAVLDDGILELGGTASLNIAGALESYGQSDVEINGDTTLDAGSAIIGGGQVIDDGLLVTGSLFVGAPVALGGGTLEAATIELGPGILGGHGIIDASAITGDGELFADNGTLVVAGSLFTDIEPEIASGAALNLTGSFVGAAIMFLGPDAVLTVDDPAAFSATPVNFTATDGVDLVGINPNSVTYSGGTDGNLQVFASSGTLITQFGMEIAAGQPGVSIVSDGAGGALITLGDELPCFTRGTGLLTPHGYRPVESLKPGDPLITATGVSRPVRWIGRRTLDLGPRAARFALPVLIMPGAFGPGLPARKLRLSPLHCVFVEGVLVPVTHLVNGATILRDETASAMTYYHVELDRHDILLAEGLACESYFDSGNRGALYHELGRRCPARRAYAESVTRGRRLAMVRRKLHQHALAAGFSLTYWPTLRAVGGGQGVTPRITKAGRWRMARFEFPAPVREITLISGVACPADTDPDSEDRRELGVCLGRMQGMRLGEGFYPRDVRDDGDWTSRVAAVNFDQPATEFVLPLAAIVQSWVRPRGTEAHPV